MISTAVATYNGAKFLPQQLDSILLQSVPVNEIVICDDGSTDGTWEILQEYQTRHPEIFKIFRNEKNLGCAENFALALSRCTGEFIFLADQDDLWEKDKVEKMLPLFSGEKIIGVYSDSRITDEELNDLHMTHLLLRGFVPEKLRSLPQTKVFFRRVPPAAHDMAIRRSALKYLLPFPRLKNVHDSFIGITIAALNGWAMTPECLTFFRQHDQNISGSGKALTIAGQLKAAKMSAAADTYRWNAKLHAFVLARLKNNIDACAEKMLKARIKHSMNRSAMGRVNIFVRWKLIFQELFSGRYFRFARGIKSVIQDLFLR